jgi:hypothetical protein
MRWSVSSGNGAESRAAVRRWRSRTFLGHAGLCVVASLLGWGCGGRTELIAVPQIGQLSSTAVVARDASVRMVARTNAWRGLPLANVTAVEVTLDNGSTRPLRVSHTDFAFVSEQGGLQPRAPSEFPNPDGLLPTGAMADAALQEMVLEPGSRVTGFLYFDWIDDSENLDLVTNLIDASTMAQFGTIRMAFRTD